MKRVFLQLSAWMKFRTANETDMRLSAAICTANIAGVADGEWALISPYGDHSAPDGSYLLNTDPAKHGTSAAGVEIADGWSNIMLPDGKGRTLNFWVAAHALSLHGKQLLSCEEFTAVMQGVEEGKTCGNDPKKTGHVSGLKSAIGIEQATGCMYVWSRDIKDLDVPWIFLMGGNWDSDAAGPRRFFGLRPDDGFNYVGARGRCDHLFPDRSEAKA